MRRENTGSRRVQANLATEAERILRQTIELIDPLLGRGFRPRSDVVNSGHRVIMYLHTDVKRQLARIALTPGQPLLVCDADEVLFEFMTTFVAYLEDGGHYYDWRTMALTGNVRRRHDAQVLSPGEVRNLINRFFVSHTCRLPSVEGAAESLRTLSEAGIQVVVLSNLPLAQRDARYRALVRHGMASPLVANVGLKGPTVRALSDAAAAPVAFIDDSPHHHDSVARHAASTHRFHFAANPRLRALQRPVENAHVHANSWAMMAGEVRSRLDSPA